MKILHTADWHVGKVLKGQSRAEEHRQVLANIVDLARREDVDVAVVAGDLFDSSVPGPEAQGLVMRALLALNQDDRRVIAIAGNHDNLHLFDAVYRPVLGQLGIDLLGYPKRPEAGGHTSFTARTGESVTVAMLPFVPARFAVRAAEAVLNETSQHSLDYARRIKDIVTALTGSFSPDSINICTMHATMLGGRRGGGERDVQTGFDYELPSSVFPTSTHYAALGHLHRFQEIDGPCPIAYSGSPLAIDFGEEANEPVALIVTATPHTRASIRAVPIVGGRRLLTLRGTLEDVFSQAEVVGDDWLRVILAEPASAGLGDRVRDKLPNALEVRLDDEHRPRLNSRRGNERSHAGRGPLELFTDFLAAENVDDPRVSAMFAELLDEATTSSGYEPDNPTRGAEESTPSSATTDTVRHKTVKTSTSTRARRPGAPRAAQVGEEA